MSEREMREFAKETASHYAPPGVRDLCKALLDKDPDVVKAALQIRDGFLPMVRGAYRTSELGSDKNFYNGEVNAYLTVLAYLQDEFGFILTDDGWEWTDE